MQLRGFLVPDMQYTTRYIEMKFNNFVFLLVIIAKRYSPLTDGSFLSRMMRLTSGMCLNLSTRALL